MFYVTFDRAHCVVDEIDAFLRRTSLLIFLPYLSQERVVVHLVLQFKGADLFVFLLDEADLAELLVEGVLIFHETI